jgi:hypothetical protein
MNYILTTCINLPQFAIDNFVRSLSETNFSEILVLFIGEEDIPKIKKIRKTNFKIEAIVNKSEDHPILNRFSNYENYLLKKENVDDVFICDSRDFLFQKNIFDFDFDKLKRYPNEKKKDIYFTMECGYIGECKINRDWFFSLFNFCNFSDSKLRADSFFNKRVSCAGAIYGNKFSILSYLNIMNSYLSVIKEKTSSVFFLDQAIHNYILYSHGMSAFSVGTVDNKDGLVNHVSWGINRKTSFVSDSGEIVNQNGEKASSVHLFDRNELFLNKMKNSIKWKNYNLKMKR